MHVGQIRTVFPEAYELRQEKGLNNKQGVKESGYQLTVEPRLDVEGELNWQGLILLSFFKTWFNKSYSRQSGYNLKFSPQTE